MKICVIAQVEPSLNCGEARTNTCVKQFEWSESRFDPPTLQSEAGCKKRT